jgi:ubiquinone/menaquinone biosynthesis C-methylase UbiE
MTASESRYVPAAGRSVFTGAYDTAVALTMRERLWRPLLVARIAGHVPPDGRTIDVGAGTGTLAITIAAARPDVEIIGIDGDPDVLDRARRKPGADGVTWRPGLAGELDLEDESVDAAAMSLLLHHLAPDAKRAALAEVHRVLRPAGRLHIADWGRPPDPLMRTAFAALQLIDGVEGTRDHAAGRLPAFIRDAGFEDVRCHRRVRTVWGSLELLEASR